MERPTILIVEDRSLMRMVLRDCLEKAFPGCAIAEAEDGAAAIEACGTRPPQLVLMDIGLPDADGIELTAQIRAMVPGVAVIIVSYHNGHAFTERARAAGALAYVVKDNLHTELIPAVASALTLTPVR